MDESIWSSERDYMARQLDYRSMLAARFQDAIEEFQADRVEMYGTTTEALRATCGMLVGLSIAVMTAEQLERAIDAIRTGRAQTRRGLEK